MLVIDMVHKSLSWTGLLLTPHFQKLPMSLSVTWKLIPRREASRPFPPWFFQVLPLKVWCLFSSSFINCNRYKNLKILIFIRCNSSLSKNKHTSSNTKHVSFFLYLNYFFCTICRFCGSQGSLSIYCKLVLYSFWRLQ